MLAVKRRPGWAVWVAFLVLLGLGGGVGGLKGATFAVPAWASGEAVWRWTLAWGFPVLGLGNDGIGEVSLPRMAMAFQFPFLEGSQAAAASLTAVEGEDDSLHADPLPLPGGGTGEGAEVLIYNTHNGETYAATDGAPRLDGKNAGVVTAAGVIEKTLRESFGIEVVRSDVIHDYPSYNESYMKSLVTFQNLLKANPGARLILDVHRDATPDRATVAIDGKDSAKILFIVGTDARAPHPRWKQNQALAQRVHEKLESLYPGLSRGVRTKDGRYHQHLHPGALLVEIGSDKNSLAEAEEAARHLARALAEVLKEQKADKGAEPPQAQPQRNQGLQAWSGIKSAL